MLEGLVSAWFLTTELLARSSFGFGRATQAAIITCLSYLIP